MTARDHILNILQRLRFFITPAHVCSYLPRDDAVTLFVDPQTEIDKHTYTTLIGLGFRRSGHHMYRPHCPNCRACVPVRIAVSEFSPNRNQRRISKRNSELECRWQDATFSAEHFMLYKQYLLSRHAGSSMTTDDPQHYQRMMLTDWGDNRLMEIRCQDQLYAVAITDWLYDGVSAVYTFFHPDQAKRSLGIYAILQQIEAARVHQLPYVYLGYWIEPCQNMSYKRNFSGLQCFNGKTWISYDQFTEEII